SQAAGPTVRRGAGTPDDVPRATTRSASTRTHRGGRARPTVSRVRRAGAPRRPDPQGGHSMRGDGRIFRKAGSRFWHMAYYVDGREVSESTKQTDEERARRELTHRIAEVRARKALPHESRVTLGRVPTCESCGALLFAGRAHM